MACNRTNQNRTMPSGAGLNLLTRNWSRQRGQGRPNRARRLTGGPHSVSLDRSRHAARCRHADSRPDNRTYPLGWAATGVCEPPITGGAKRRIPSSASGRRTGGARRDGLRAAATDDRATRGLAAAATLSSQLPRAGFPHRITRAIDRGGIKRPDADARHRHRRRRDHGGHDVRDLRPDHVLRRLKCPATPCGPHCHRP